MAVLVLLELLVSLLFVLVFSQNNTYVPRILGGNRCSYENHSYAVIILFSSKSKLCGGSIITPRWVLTAAHCVIRKDIIQGNVYLRTGYNYETFVQYRRALKGIPHPRFNRSKLRLPEPELRYDVGVILVNIPFRRKGLLLKGQLAVPGFSRSCRSATAVGIRSPDEYNFLTEIEKTLTCVDLPIVDHEVCRETWPGSVVDDSLVCTMVEEGGKDACRGDSGGPLVCRNVIIGIISAGKGCARPRSAATYTKVEHFIGWIHETLHYYKPDKRLSQRRGSADELVTGTAWLLITFALCFI